MFWGEDLFVFPLVPLHTAIGYSMLRDKIKHADGHYQVQ